MLLVIATPQGRQIYDRANAVEAERGIKTFTWDFVEDNDPEIHQEHDDQEHDEDSLDLAFEKKSVSKGSQCTILQKFITEYNVSDDKAVTICNAGCKCISGRTMKGKFTHCKDQSFGRKA